MEIWNKQGERCVTNSLALSKSKQDEQGSLQTFNSLCGKGPIKSWAGNNELEGWMVRRECCVTGRGDQNVWHGWEGGCPFSLNAKPITTAGLKHIQHKHEHSSSKITFVQFTSTGTFHKPYCKLMLRLTLTETISLQNLHKKVSIKEKLSLYFNSFVQFQLI
jgi:hypothetical protein